MVLFAGGHQRADSSSPAILLLHGQQSFIRRRFEFLRYMILSLTTLDPSPIVTMALTFSRVTNTMAWDVRQGWRAVFHPDQDDHAAVEGVAGTAGLPLHAHLAEVRHQAPPPHSPKLHSSGHRHRPNAWHQLSRGLVGTAALHAWCARSLFCRTPCMLIQNIQERCSFCSVKVIEYCKSPRSVDRVSCVNPQ